MQQLNFDTGLVKYNVNDNATLCFNPSDLNVYNRFFASTDEVKQIEQDLVDDCKDKPLKEQLAMLGEADRKVKALLESIFPGNDFNSIFGGVNVMGVGVNGERLITNFFAAIQPLMEGGVQRIMDSKATKAVQAAKKRRGSK